LQWIGGMNSASYTSTAFWSLNVLRLLSVVGLLASMAAIVSVFVKGVIVIKVGVYSSFEFHSVLLIEYIYIRI
jgi:hypothetical protein